LYIEDNADNDAGNVFIVTGPWALHRDRVLEAAGVRKTRWPCVHEWWVCVVKMNCDAHGSDAGGHAFFSAGVYGVCDAWA
jgi:hypothetical protein